MPQATDIDYDALAKKHGAITPPEDVNYDALASQHGSVDAVTPTPPLAPTDQASRMSRIQQLSRKPSRTQQEQSELTDLSSQAKQFASAPQQYTPPGQGAAGVAWDQAKQVARGLPDPILGLPGALYGAGKTLLTGDAMGAVKSAADGVKGIVQPFATAGKGAASLAAPSYVNAPSDEDWQQAARGAGGQLTGAVLGKVGGMIAEGATPEGMVTTASKLREPLPTPKGIAKITRPVTNVVRSGAASGLEKGARALSKLDKAPNFNEVPSAPAYMDKDIPATPETKALTAGMSFENQPIGQLKPVAAPSTPIPATPELEALQAQQAVEQAPLGTVKPPATPSEPIPMAKEDVTPAPWQEPEPLKQESIPMPNPPDLKTPPGEFPQHVVESVERQIKPTPSFKKVIGRNTPKILKELPGLATKTGAEFDKHLLEGLDAAGKNIETTENAIPRETLIEKAPITEAWDQLEQEYKESGYTKSADKLAKINKAWEKVAGVGDEGEMVPWQDFLKFKRGFFKEIANIKDSATRKAYRTLMDTTSNLSPELAAANKSFSTLKQAVDAANLDTVTGRRISSVGKALPKVAPPPGKKSLNL